MSDDASSSNRARPQRRPIVEALTQHFKDHKIDCGLWVIRILTIFFTFTYFIPIFGNSQNAYYKALIANAATNALRLHQRLGGLGRIQFSREFLATLLTEDSCHYLFYSMIFIYVAPVTLVLIPVVLFAILHSASYSLTLLDTLGQNTWWGARLMISLVEFQSLNILRLIAFTEIVMMPLTVFLVLMGRASLLTPFIYYHFLTQRYTSRRNPYNRNMFFELKTLIQRTAENPKFPSFVKQFLLAIVTFTTKLAPPQMPASQPQQ